MVSEAYLVLKVVVCLTVSIKADTNKNPDVLFVIVDDLRHLSNENVTLPNIDKLKAKGVNFNAYAQQALCAPSRNSLLTGRRPDSLRLYDFYSYWRHTVANFTTLPQYFKENGYDTVSVGKVFHPGISSNFSDDYPYSWSQLPYHPPTEIYKDAPVCKDPRTKQYQDNLICPVPVKRQPGKSLPDIESLRYAKDVLKSRGNYSKPLFLAVGFHKPHIPLKFPKRFLEKVPIKICPPKHPLIPEDMPTVAWQPWSDVTKRDDIKRLRIPFPYGIMPEEWTLKIKRSYVAAALYVDSLIGRLLAHVDLRKTIVVLTSDHGWSLGENGLWAKYSNFDVALRVPLVIAAPGIKPKAVHTPVELIDLFPTLVNLAHLPKNIPNCHSTQDKTLLCFEGKNLVPFMKSNIKTAAYAFSQYPRPSNYPQKNSDKPKLKDIKIMGYSVKTKRYRYTEWASFNNTSFTNNWNKIYGVELYDHISDSDESNNLYLNAKYTNTVRKLSKVLRSHVDSSE